MAKYRWDIHLKKHHLCVFDVVVSKFITKFLCAVKCII